MKNATTISYLGVFQDYRVSPRLNKNKELVNEIA